MHDVQLLHAVCAIVGFTTLAMAAVSTLFAGFILLGLRLHRNDRYRRWGVVPGDARDEQVILLHVASQRPEFRREIEDFLDDVDEVAALSALLLGRAKTCLRLCVVFFAAASAFALSTLI
jgi:hypothetical protein